jgi:hypothetical protein
MRRVLRPGGRLVVVVWGDRSLCGWSPLFSIIDGEVETEVCPLFFRLGENDTLADLCADASFDVLDKRRMATTLEYADADEACALRSSAAPSRSRGRASTTMCAHGCAAAISKRWNRGSANGVTRFRRFVVVKAMS